MTRKLAHLDNLLRLQKSLQPPLGEEGGRGLDIEDDHLPGHRAHLDQGQLALGAQVDPLQNTHCTLVLYKTGYVTSPSRPTG